jgi:S1-C subfamily serine protease
MRNCVRLLASLACALVWLCSGAADAQRPSFDCNKARYPDEFAICQSPQLAELDNVIAAAYGYLKSMRGRPFADETGIPFWRLRQACQSDTNCILQRQIEAIRAYQAAGAPVSLPLWVANSGQPTRPESQAPPPLAAPIPGPQQEETRAVKTGTGFFVTNDGRVITNAHVVRDCTEIHVGTGQGNFADARVIARDTTNDLALLKVDINSSRVASLRFPVRLGENVEAFGYPLTQLLATTGNFTTGNVTALAGIGDDSRYIQVSAPVQPGNSAGPLLDENGNLVGIVTSKLNVVAALKDAGDIPENVNFAIKASVVANFLQDNSIKFQTGEATQPMKAADLAEQAKALSVYIECR